MIFAPWAYDLDGRANRVNVGERRLTGLVGDQVGVAGPGDAAVRDDISTTIRTQCIGEDLHVAIIRHQRPVTVRTCKDMEGAFERRVKIVGPDHCRRSSCFNAREDEHVTVLGIRSPAFDGIVMGD
jgi:hypothetical protein